MINCYGQKTWLLCQLFTFTCYIFYVELFQEKNPRIESVVIKTIINKDILFDVFSEGIDSDIVILTEMISLFKKFQSPLVEHLVKRKELLYKLYFFLLAHLFYLRTLWAWF